MLSFHNDPKVKAKYLARVRAHRRADHLVQGVGWEQNGVTKGCAVGCAAWSAAWSARSAAETKDHRATESTDPVNYRLLSDGTRVPL